MIYQLAPHYDGELHYRTGITKKYIQFEICTLLIDVTFAVNLKMPMVLSQVYRTWLPLNWVLAVAD